MKKDTRFKKKYVSNSKVKHQGQVWTVCKDTYTDDNKHVYYKISRGAWKKYVRGDLLAKA